MNQRWQTTPRKQFLPDTTIRYKYELKETVTAHTRPAQVQNKRKPITETGKWAQNPTTSQEAV